MARVPNKHNREQNLDFQGFLSNLQDWELSLKEKDKMLNAQSNGERQNLTGLLGANKMSTVKTSPANYSSSKDQKFEYSRRSQASSSILSTLSAAESSPDANSEKELGNEYFKQKMFKEAIDCYSRSIALSPTAVAYANRAMAFLKIKRFEEAENDCTEALDLDDRYIKAYSRRATARKELGKFKASTEDSEFALRLDPQNHEIKKQHAETKALYEKEILGKASRLVTKSNQGAQRVGVIEVQTDQTKDTEGKCMKAGTTSSRQESGGSLKGATLSSGADNFKRDQALDKKQELKTVHDLASRAASRAMAEAAKKVSTPKSAYQFEVSWRGLSGDRALQAHFLKAISPATLPQLFKNALSAPILIDIIKCISSFFVEETNLAISFLDSLKNVPRFDMIIMCLSSSDKADLNKIWEEVFFSSAASADLMETLTKLRLKYCPGGWKMHVLEDSNSLIKEM